VPTTILNAILADSVEYMANKIENKMKELVKADGQNENDVRQVAIESVVQQTLKKHYVVVFNGDNYTEEYLEEAKRRGLPHLRLAPEALGAWDAPKNIDLLDRMKVSTRTEQEARSVVLRENFLGQLMTEANCQQLLVKNMVIPAALKHQAEISTSLKAVKEVMSGNYEEQEGAVVKIRDHIKALYRAADKMDQLIKEAHDSKLTIKDKFAKFHPELIAALTETRTVSDEIEEIIDADLWPLPRYSEVLFY